MQIEFRSFLSLFTALVTLMVATTMAETTTKVPLHQLAASRFGHLSAAEEELIKAAANGEVADCTRLSGNDRVIHGDLLSWLCTDASAYVNRGISITGADIDGEVNLDWARISFPLVSQACVFREEIRLGESHLAALYLINTSIKGLKAGGIMVEHGVYLVDGFEARGNVELVGATIGEDLDCHNGHFLGGSNASALIAERARIEGSVVLNNGFKAEDQVDLRDAIIGGSLVCDNGQFTSKSNAYALSANGAEIKHFVVLAGGFKADGEVDLANTKIGDNLNCASGQFVGKGNVTALAATDAKITGDVLLVDGFKADGAVDLVDANIGSNLICNGGQFINKETTPALNATGVNVRGTVYFCNGFKSVGEVSVASAIIGGSLVCLNGQLDGNGKSALYAESAKISGSVVIDAGSVAAGEVEFLLAEIAGAFQWRGRMPPEKAKLSLRLTKVGMLSNAQGSWPKPGNLELDGLVYERIDNKTHPNAEAQLGWLGRQPPDHFRPQPYEQLASVLRKMGLDEDARRVLIAKNEDRGHYLQLPIWDWHRPWDFNRLFEWFWYKVFGNILIGYGYQPWRAFVISLGVILLGWWVFRSGYFLGLINPKGSEKFAVDKHGPHPFSNAYPKFNAFVYSLETFAPLIKLGISDYWAPNSNRSALLTLRRMRLATATGGALRVYLWCHIVAGWVLTTLWVGGLTGLLKT